MDLSNINYLAVLVAALSTFILTTDVSWGMIAGLLTGLGWVAMAIAIISVFENRSWTYISINGGYMTVAFTVMGAILGAWR